MPEEQQIAFQITYASVEVGAHAGRATEVERILRAERVLAGIREPDSDTVTLLLPVTDDGSVLALDDEDRLRFDLSIGGLQSLFAEQEMSLQLGLTDDALADVDVELDEEFAEAFERLDDAAASPEDLPGFGLGAADAADEDLFAPVPVRVIEFSRRGPWAARLTAQMLQVEVDYLEVGTWSACRYRTGEPHAAVSGSRSDLPVVEVNVPADGDAWIEVTAPGGASALFWPDSERLTRPVLDVDGIRVPESAEVYRRMLAESDGTRDELLSLGLGSRLDIDRAHRACMPEAVGGTAGRDRRMQEFVAAFGVPEALITAAMLQDGSGDRRFIPRGWTRTAGDFLVGGLVETTPLTRRGRGLDRFARFLRERPLLAGSLSTAELLAGAAAVRSRSRLWRALGILLVIDAVADVVILAVRNRRR